MLLGKADPPGGVTEGTAVFGGEPPAAVEPEVAILGSEGMAASRVAGGEIIGGIGGGTLGAIVGCGASGVFLT